MDDDTPPPTDLTPDAAAGDAAGEPADPGAGPQTLGAWWRGQLGWFVALAAFALVSDVGSKFVAIELMPDRVFYNPTGYFGIDQVLMGVITVAVLTLVGLLFRGRQITHAPVLWGSGGLLVGAVFAQAVSALVWEEGVPDFIEMGLYTVNVADVYLVVGLVTLFGSLAHNGARFVLAGRALRDGS